MARRYISKDALVAEIEKAYKFHEKRGNKHDSSICDVLYGLSHRIDTLEVIDPYEQCIQYASVESGIKAHAETYSFNIESELFNQLTKEQQTLWRKEIEQACISGGEMGVELAKDIRYKENVEMKEVDLDYIKDELDRVVKIYKPNEDFGWGTLYNIATYFFELGIKAKIE